jgi:hypothetical protein
MSNPPFQAGTLTKIRAGGSFGKYLPIDFVNRREHLD